jgi:cytochrome c-type biogenesis protein CcmH
MLKDPVLEARAREVSKHLRCVVCQNETIDESNAEIARDMRVLLRTRILAGDTNEGVIAFMVSRYGDYVLLKPRFTTRTYLLWFGPFLVLGLGAFVVYRRLRGGPALAAPVPLTPEEKAALAELAPGERTP